MASNGIEGALRFSGVQNSPPLSTNKAAENRSRAQLPEVRGEGAPGSDRLLFNGFSLNTRNVPALEASGPIAAFRVVDAIRLLNQNVQATKSPLVIALKQSTRFGDLQQNRLLSLRNSLEDLSASVSTLLKDESLNTRKGSSSRSERVELSASRNAVPGDQLSVAPLRLAADNVLFSDKQDSLAALGLTGSFLINGHKIDVVSTDSVFEIRDKINFGEDLNKNGRLDGPEDLNENGSIDIIHVPFSEGGSGRFNIEDINGNGVLDPDEDLNDNGLIDGGSLNNKVVANVINSRLVLTSFAGGNQSIGLQDDDGILLSLGFFELDSKGNPIQQERQFSDDNPPANLIQTPRTAQIQVNGKTVSNATNIFSELTQGTEVTVKRSSSDSVLLSVLLQVEQAFNQIESFAEAFNESVEKLNEILTLSSEFGKDFDFQNIRNDLTGDALKPTRKKQQANANFDALQQTVENLNKIGISIQNQDKTKAQEIAISSTLDSIQRGLSLTRNAPEALLNRLTSFGIQTLQDDTFKIDGPELKRALVVNTDEVIDLFLNEETGILPTLERNLQNILEANVGDLDIKSTRIDIGTRSPNFLGREFKKISENLVLGSNVQNLITVA
ncbi:MAG: flagellar filament capping protein FliD [Candidatus Nitrohelix vancouverensis]|uniref:Flagellar filament capping protein FliD n=1 Tax=Candidatus Nitrohelix vancouverensis TaxID=2705534 RepID=A0A7T0C0T3_9BACT|nr:MAG: flagellar filament capping protein FliD [Candidatus Nitrohelix vancouverensis]